eukprot:jgi/Tetstr1/454216/TSEL_041135.t1
MALPSAAMLGDYARRPALATALSVTVLWVASLAYLCMALGVASVPAARHLDWLVTTPLLLADLGLAAGAPVHEIVLACGADVLMVAAGYLAVASPGHRTAMWSAGMAFFAPVLWMVYRWHARAPDSKKMAFKLTLALWAAYPAIFFMDESSPVTQWTYAAVDVAAKAGVGALLVWAR